MNRILEAKEGFEKRLLVKLLSNRQGNVSEAARAAGVHRSNFLRLLRKHNIKASDYRQCEFSVSANIVDSGGMKPI